MEKIQQKVTLKHNVWEKITEVYFSGDWALYRTLRAENRLPDGYRDMIHFARTHRIDESEELVRTFISLILPYENKEEDPSKIGVGYGFVVIGGLNVPKILNSSTDNKTDTGITRSKGGVRELTDAEKIQSCIAHAIWKVRDTNYKLAVANVEEFEALAKGEYNTWMELFEKANKSNVMFEDLKKELHYPKAKMYFWILRNKQDEEKKKKV